MVDTRQTRRRLLQTAGVAIGGSIVMGTASADHEETWRFHAELTTEAETHDVEAPSSGHATFEIPPDDHRIHYTVGVEWLCDGTQAHIHLGGEGEDGPVAAWLYPEEGQEPVPIEGRFDGTLAEGTISVEDLVGPLEGASEDEIVMALVEEDAYVNVHTEAHPAGEIRGQIRPDADTEAAIAEAMDGVESPDEEEVGPEEEGDYEEGDDEPDDHDDEEDESEAEEDPEEETEADDADEMDDEGEGDDGDPQLALGDLYIGAGTTGEEYIELVNVGDEHLDFTGWTLEDRVGEGVVNGGGEEPWRFPDGLVLEPDEVLTIYTNEGETSVENREWYLGLSGGRDIWRQDADDTVVVRDAGGNVVFEGQYDVDDVIGADDTSSIRGIFDSVRALFA